MLRTNEGGEYVLDVFRNFYEVEVIVHEITLSYTPQHKGTIERKCNDPPRRYDITYYKI